LFYGGWSPQPLCIRRCTHKKYELLGSLTWPPAGFAVHYRRDLPTHPRTCGSPGCDVRCDACMTGRRLPSYRRPRSLHLHLHHDRHRPPRPYRFIRRDGVRQRVGTEGRRRSETSSCVAATGTHCSKRRTKAARAPTRTHLSVGSFSQDSGCQSGGRAQTAGRIRPSVQLAAEKRSRPRGASYSVSCRGEARRGAGKENREPSRPARGGRRRSLLGLA